MKDLCRAPDTQDGQAEGLGALAQTDYAARLNSELQEWPTTRRRQCFPGFGRGRFRPRVTAHSVSLAK